MMTLQGKQIVLGVTGGVAAYKAAFLVRLLTRAGAQVRVAMTKSATRFVTPMTFQALSGQPVCADLWDDSFLRHMPHIDISRGADLMLVAPASADFMARLAQGRADELLCAMALARDCPLLIAPAMNRQMWENPAVCRNANILRQDGVTLLGPVSGEQACGEEGEGRMMEPEDILESLEAFLTPKWLASRKVLITAGPTFEAIDTVRGMSNLSSGRMGYAVARAAAFSGADVCLVSGPVCLSPPLGVERVSVISALEMYKAVMERVQETDIFISVAAVADYRVTEVSGKKLKKDLGVPKIHLALNPDILAEVASLEKPPFCVGFAAESENLEAYAKAKRRKKKLPLMVGNLIQDGFGGAFNKLVLFDEKGSHPLPPADKDQLAFQLIEHIAPLARSFCEKMEKTHAA